MMLRRVKEEIITTLDYLYPNTYEYMDKVTWIDTLERRIEEEIIKTHEPEVSKEDEQLWAYEPYTDLYIYYMEAQIDKNNNEFDKYNNHMALFNNAYAVVLNHHVTYSVGLLHIELFASQYFIERS
jgi:hypothetical protein